MSEKPVTKINKRQIIIITMLLVIVFFAGMKYYEFLMEKQKVEDLGEGVILSEVGDAETETELIVVHIKGEVQNPGVLSLPLGSRLIDAVEKVGLSTQADVDAVNLARILNDQDEVYIPAKASANAIFSEEQLMESSPSRIVEQKTDKIDINNANSSEFQILSGIGESKAANIINYRENVGRFNSIEDIKNVSGVGDSLFEKIKGDITVD